MKRLLAATFASLFNRSEQLNKGRLSNLQLRVFFVAFFLLLALPSSFISFIAYEKIQNEALLQYQRVARTLNLEINAELSSAVAKEDARKDAEYSFLTFHGEEANFLQPSILSKVPLETELPGVIGYFYVDQNGQFSSPLLPLNVGLAERYGLSKKDVEKRHQLIAQLHDVLVNNQLISANSLPLAYSQNAHSGTLKSASELSSKSSIDLKWGKKAIKPTLPKLPRRKEKNYILTEPKVIPDAKDNKPVEDYGFPVGLSIDLFESELEPFRFNVLSSGHLIAHRQVWRKGSRVVQGAVISLDTFIKEGIAAKFKRSTLASFSNLTVFHKTDALFSYPPELNEDTQGRQLGHEQVLLSASLSSPFQQIRLEFSATEMPDNESIELIFMVFVILLLALVFGTYALYRLTAQQSSLMQRQQDFISSVSHELKTPITSIRMYGEVLQQGWMNESKKSQYYDFIVSESDRLARLVSNILQVANINQGQLTVELKSVALHDIKKRIATQMESQVTASGFRLSIDLASELGEVEVLVDEDAFTQVMINLVDNAIKYSFECEKQQVDVAIALVDDGRIKISVRDYGIGLDIAEANRIFDLFYRVGNELTRKTKGTGIGLALVRELTKAMNGEVTVVRHSIGAEFVLYFNQVDNVETS